MTDPDGTPPTEPGGTEVTRFNALKHGILSRYTVLPWEDPDEYHALVGALAAEHCPQGPTEEHLVEELAGILWRKRRLRLAEASSYRRGLESTLSPWSDTVRTALVHLDVTKSAGQVMEAIQASSKDTEEDLADIEEDEAMTLKAVGLLKSGKKDAYQNALETLREDTRDWWQDTLTRDPVEEDEDEETFEATAESLCSFLEHEVLPWLANRRKEVSNRSLIREQAFGEATEPNKLERLGRYEVHLDRKLERTLTMLIRLQDLRGGSANP